MQVAARAFTRSALIYTLGTACVVPVGIISLAVTTRFLGVSDFGRLSTLLAITSMLTVLAGVAALQGVLMVVYGTSGDDDGDGDAGDGDDVVAEDLGYVDETARRVELIAEEKKRLLGSGLVLVMIVATAWCGLAALLSPLLAKLFLGSGSWTGAVLLTTFPAWTGSLWRFAHQVWRLERQPVIWSWLQLLRVMLVLVGSVLCLALGLGIEGVLIGTAGGTTISILVSLWFSRKKFSIRPRLEDFPRFVKRGARMVPVSVVRITQSHVAILLLSATSTPTSVGLFTAATRIAQIPSYFGSGFLTGWQPLIRSPIGMAGRELRGRAGFNERLFTMLMVMLIGLTVLISLGSEIAIRVAAPSFASAADLIPIVAAGFLAMDSFHAYYRACRFPHRLWWYTALHLLYLGPYGAAVVLAHDLGPAYAVGIAQVAGSLFVLASLVFLDHRGRQPLPVPWLKVGGVALAGFACVATAQLTGADTRVRVAMGLLGILAFPIILKVTGVLTSWERQNAVSLARSLVDRPMSGIELRRRLSAIGLAEREALVSLGWRREPDEAGGGERVDELTSARFVRGLRAFSGLPAPPTVYDAAVGQYLLATGGTLKRDMMASQLAEENVSLIELHELDQALIRFRRLRRRGLRMLDGGGTESGAPMLGMSASRQY